MNDLYLPIVESLVNNHSNLSFSNVKIIGVQHILETTHAMFRSLYKLGLQPQNISIIGKCYSTCREVYEEMKDDGIDVSSGSFTYSSHLPFDEQFSDAIKGFLSSRIQDLYTSNYDLIIVLDDGGKFINFLSQFSDLSTPIVGIEQTTAGYEEIKNKKLKFPVINVARSPLKLNLESPLIAEAAAERLYKSLTQRNLFPNKALIIGAGAIGNAMKKRLSSEMKIVIYDNKTSLSDTLLEFEALIGLFPLIIGCTGKKSIPCELHHFLSKETILTSVSSSDREFDAVHLRKLVGHETDCHKDLVINGINLINSGFPVNFDGDRENIEPEKIQLTIALITAAILKSLTLTEKSPKIYPVDKKLEKFIEEIYLQNFAFIN